MIQFTVIIFSVLAKECPHWCKSPYIIPGGAYNGGNQLEKVNGEEVCTGYATNAGGKIYCGVGKEYQKPGSGNCQHCSCPPACLTCKAGSAHNGGKPLNPMFNYACTHRCSSANGWCGTGKHYTVGGSIDCSTCATVPNGFCNDDSWQQTWGFDAWKGHLNFDLESVGTSAGKRPNGNLGMWDVACGICAALKIQNDPLGIIESGISEITDVVSTIQDMFGLGKTTLDAGEAKKLYDQYQCDIREYLHYLAHDESHITKCQLCHLAVDQVYGKVSCALMAGAIAAISSATAIPVMVIEMILCAIVAEGMKSIEGALQEAKVSSKYGGDGFKQQLTKMKICHSQLPQTSYPFCDNKMKDKVNWDGSIHTTLKDEGIYKKLGISVDEDENEEEMLM